MLELSRQRLRPSLMETHTSPCAHCHGTGIIRSTESLSLQVLRVIEREAIKGRAAEIQAAVPKGIDLYLDSNPYNILSPSYQSLYNQIHR